MALEPIVPVEEVDETLRTLAERLEQAGREAGEAVLEKRAASGKVVRRIETPRFAEEFIAGAREALEAEVDIARPAGFAEDIEPTELEREIVKNALARLKLEQLRRIAANRELDYRGNA